MKGPNLSSWALDHGAVMRFFLVLSVGAGVLAYLSLGRQEDPDFTIKNMLVSAEWPGASVQEIGDQVAEPIERAIQTIPEVDIVKTTIYPGRMVANVEVRDEVTSKELPAIWTRVRQRVSDRAPTLPEGVQGPHFNDDFGDTYGNIYALTGDGYSLPQLKEFADQLRDELRQLPDVGRVEFQGEPEERVYVEYESAKLATAGLDPQALMKALRDTNTVSSAGVVDTRSERVRINVTGTFDSIEAIRRIGVVGNGRHIRLGDVATVRRALADPPTFRMRFDGRDAVGVMIAQRKGGDVIRLGKASQQVIESFRHRLPLGVNLDVVTDQPAVVQSSISEFTMSLLEAVVIVLIVSFVALGKRPGIVVALSIPVVLAVTFAIMLALGIPLHRVSLGALIIALGLLVDDAMIVIEQIDAHLLEGWEKTKAVTSAYLVTAQPMLVGTLVTMIGFLPIALAQSAAGEYSGSIFSVVAISLGLSWVVAVLVTPWFAHMLLREAKPAEGEAGHGHGTYDGKFYTRFRATVRWALGHRLIVILVTAASFAGSIALFAWGVPQQFFPNSDRPELLVDLRVAQNGSFDQTLAVAQRLERKLKGNADVVSVTSYVGGGSPRFYLSLDVQTPNVALAQFVVRTTGGDGRDRVRHQVEEWIANDFREARGRVSTLELGPPVGQAFKIRLSALDHASLVPAAERIEALMRRDPRLGDVNKDYGETYKSVAAVVDQDRIRALGISSLTVEQALQGALDGVPITRYRDRDRSLPVIARLSSDERQQLDRLAQVNVPTGNGGHVPLSQVARLEPSFELAEMHRRSSLPTITIQADVLNAQPQEIADAHAQELDAILATLPEGARMAFGGSIEESGDSQASVMSQVPIALVLILVLLVLQLQSNVKLALVVLTGPLALIGIALILSLFRIPFGFVAMLGGLSLFGMVIRNSIILVSQIEALEAEGMGLHDAIVEATVHRLRPIMLTALAAILAMIPLTRSVFWGPMAWAIMGGLMVATLLTLVFLPAAYAAAYRVKPASEASHA